MLTAPESIDTETIPLYDLPPTAEQPLPSALLLHAPAGMNPEGLQTWVTPRLTKLSNWLHTSAPLVLGDQFRRRRDTVDPRHISDPDHQWHTDRSHLSDSGLPIATLLYAEEVADHPPGIMLLDTSQLLDALFKKMPDVTLDELWGMHVWLSRSKFYDTIVPSYDDVTATTRALEKSAADSLSRKAYERAYQFPAIARPLIQVNPVSLAPCLYIDTLRSRRLTGVELERAQTIHAALDDMLADPPQGTAYTHEWQEGDVLIFPHFGTLHKALPGNHGTRLLQRILLHE